MMDTIAARLQLINPALTIVEATGAIGDMIEGRMIKLTHHYNLPRESVRYCASWPTPDRQLAALCQLLDQLGVPLP